MDDAAEAHMRELATTFGRALRQRRLIELDISLSELAARCGLTKNHLSLIEGGRNNPKDIRLSSMARIAIALGADVRSMLGSASGGTG
jgi:transcriptional regulator with XRE-family HTH domain